jgi:hypothetical protein
MSNDIHETLNRKIMQRQKIIIEKEVLLNIYIFYSMHIMSKNLTN